MNLDFICISQVIMVHLSGMVIEGMPTALCVLFLKRDKYEVPEVVYELSNKEIP